MPAPCDDESSFPFFEKVFTDIGDEQTVERDLSTFSGHVENIVSFVEECDANTLVLLDELFAGPIRSRARRWDARSWSTSEERVPGSS